MAIFSSDLDYRQRFLNLMITSKHLLFFADLDNSPCVCTSLEIHLGLIPWCKNLHRGLMRHKKGTCFLESVLAASGGLGRRNGSLLVRHNWLKSTAWPLGTCQRCIFLAPTQSVVWDSVAQHTSRLESLQYCKTHCLSSVMINVF